MLASNDQYASNNQYDSRRRRRCGPDKCSSPCWGLVSFLFIGLMIAVICLQGILFAIPQFRIHLYDNTLPANIGHDCANAYPLPSSCISYESYSFGVKKVGLCVNATADQVNGIEECNQIASFSYGKLHEAQHFGLFDNKFDLPFCTQGGKALTAFSIMNLISLIFLFLLSLGRFLSLRCCSDKRQASDLNNPNVNNLHFDDNDGPRMQKVLRIERVLFFLVVLFFTLSLSSWIPCISSALTFVSTSLHSNPNLAYRLQGEGIAVLGIIFGVTLLPGLIFMRLIRRIPATRSLVLCCCRLGDDSEESNLRGNYPQGPAYVQPVVAVAVPVQADSRYNNNNNYVNMGMVASNSTY